MAYVTLNEAKAHLNIDLDWTEDDNYIISLLEMAEVVVANHIHDTLSGLEDVNGAVPRPLVHGIKLLVSHFYENREPLAVGVSVANIPYSFEYLFDPYVNRTIA